MLNSRLLYLTHQKNYIPKVRIIYKDDLEDYNIVFDKSSYRMEDLKNKTNAVAKIDTIEKDKGLESKKDDFLKDNPSKETEYGCEFDIGRNI